MTLSQETRDWARRVREDLDQSGPHSSVERVTAIGLEMEQLAKGFGRESRDIEAQRLAKRILDGVKNFKERVIPVLETVTTLREEVAQLREANQRLSGDTGRVAQLRADNSKLAASLTEGERLADSLVKAVEDVKAEKETAEQGLAARENEMEQLRSQVASLERKTKSKEQALEQVKSELAKRVKSRDEEIETLRTQRQALKDKETKQAAKIAAQTAEMKRLRDGLEQANKIRVPLPRSSSGQDSTDLVCLDDDEDDAQQYSGPLPTPPMSSDPDWPPDVEQNLSRTQSSSPTPLVPQKRKATVPLTLDRNGKPMGCVQLGSRRRW